MTLDISYKGTRVVVSVCKAVPVWECSMLVRLEKTRQNVYSTQYFRSVEEMVTYERICS